MASLKIIRPPLCGDAAHETPRHQWPALLEERVNFCKNVLPSDCRLLLFFVEDAEKADWMGFATREAYLRDGLHLDPEMVDLALRGLQIAAPDKAIGINQAVVLGKHGRPKKGQEKGCNTTLKRGTAEHWLARLDRDGHSELASAVRAGKWSANQAAKQIGYRKGSFSVSDDVDLAAAALVRRFGLGEVRAALDRLEAAQ